jgi:hypothetical protein
MANPERSTQPQTEPQINPSSAEQEVPINPSDESLKTSQNATGKTFWDLAHYMLSDWRSVPHFLSILLIVGIIFLLIWWAALGIAGWHKFEVYQTPGGGIIYRTRQDETLSFLLAASAPWSSTNFEVKKGDILRIRASGRVNLAIHHLIEAANSDQRALHAWVGPDGMSDLNRLLLKKKDIWRERYLLVPGKPDGALIVGVSSNNLPPSDSKNIWYAGSEWDGQAPESGFLWFAVNDVLLTQDSKDAYEVPPEHKEPEYLVPRKFEDIAKDQYWNIWFDDNVGSFMVTVKKDR